MLTFTYKARDTKTNQITKAEIQSESADALGRALLKQGLIPIEIELKGEKALSSKGGGRVKGKDRILYTRQLSTLINAGLPLAQSLRTVGSQTGSKALQLANSQIIADVEGGSRLADAFGKHPRIFNELYVQLIAAGEASGTLDEALERIANQQEKDGALLSKIRGALLYPIIVVVVIIGVLIFMMTTVIPQIEQLYKDLGRDLPFVTSLLVGFSRVFTDYWFVLILLVVGAGFGIRAYRHTESGRAFFDRTKLRIPLFGQLFMKLYMARFARIGATLMSASVPLLDTLRMIGNSISNVHVKKDVEKAAQKVKGGVALSAALEDAQYFLPLVSQMINIGEQSGALDTMLNKTASYYENEIDDQIKAISTTIEPILLVFLAGIAGIIVGAVLLPIYGLVGQSIAL
jgi:type IV pilus assembly protein PilC